MFRAWADVVNSNMRSWPGGRKQIEDIVRDPLSAKWRGRGMIRQTHALIASAYRPGMNDASAPALFYVYRNQLLFDQQLHCDARCFVLDYDWLIANVELSVRQIADPAGISVCERMLRTPDARSAHRRPSPDVLDYIAALAQEMHARLFATASHRRSGAATAPASA